MEKILFWFECLRAYALPMSIMAWAIPFSFACFNGGKILYGVVALFGIICAHLGANLFDDVIDYKKFLKSKEKDTTMNLKKGKCKFFFDGSLKLSKAISVVVVLFLLAIIVGLLFTCVYKLPIVMLMAVTGLLCLVYPISGYLGLSEIIIGAIYSPLLFTGVYYVMTGTLSSKLEWLSLSFALVTITLLYTDFFLDYNTDKQGGKKTIPVLSGSKQNAYYFYIFIIFLIFANLFFGIHSHIFEVRYCLIFLSIVPALKTVGNLQYYIDKEIKDEKDFMSVMNDTQKFIAIFAGLCVVVFAF